MNKRHTINFEQCYCSLTDFYDNVAKVFGERDISKLKYDCRKLHISKAVLQGMIDYYNKERGASSYTITAMLIQFGPKADLISDDYEVEIEDGFIVRGE